MNSEIKRFNFKEYYQNNPEFRARHQQKMNEKIQCPKCNKMISRCNYQRHLKTKRNHKVI